MYMYTCYIARTSKLELDAFVSWQINAQLQQVFKNGKITISRN